MSIVVACSCGKKYQVADDSAGKKMRCKACQGVIAIPASQTAPADEFDDFGDDFGGGDDFGDLGDQGEAFTRKPKTGGKKSGAKSKAKPKAGGKKKSKGKSEMSPAVKYSLAGGIVVVTVGIVLGILYARGVIGGGKKGEAQSSDGGGNDTAANMSAPGVPVGPGPGGDPAPSGQEQNQTTPPKAGKSQSKSNQPVLGAPAKKANPENAPLAATELLKQNPIGSKTLEKKTIRVQGTVARPWNQGWIYLTGDGRRTIACLFKQPPQPPPAAGQTVVVEGTFFESLPEHVTIGNCRVVPASGSGAGEDAGGFPLLLSNARVSWAKRVWTVSFQYRFVDGRPDPALYYFFEGQFPGGQMFLHRVKGSELQPAGFIHKRVTLFQVYPDSGDTVFDVYFSKSQTSRSTKDRMARTVKVPFKAPKLWLYSSYTTEELLAAAAPGDQSLIGKRIRVTGRMAIGVAVGRDFKLTGSNGRNITCRASVQEKSRPPVGAEVVVDGVVAAVNKFGVTLAVCRFGNVQPNANQAAVLRSENNGVTKSSTLPVVVQ